MEISVFYDEKEHRTRETGDERIIDTKKPTKQLKFVSGAES